MNYIKIKEAQTKGSVTKNIDFLVPVDAIAKVSGNTTSTTITLSSGLDPISGLTPTFVIAGFGTAIGNEPTQSVYALIDEVAKKQSVISDYLEINGTADLTVTRVYG